MWFMLKRMKRKCEEKKVVDGDKRMWYSELVYNYTKTIKCDKAVGEGVAFIWFNEYIIYWGCMFLFVWTQIAFIMLEPLLLSRRKAVFVA